MAGRNTFDILAERQARQNAKRIAKLNEQKSIYKQNLANFDAANNRRTIKDLCHDCGRPYEKHKRGCPAAGSV